MAMDTLIYFIRLNCLELLNCLEQIVVVCHRRQSQPGQPPQRMIRFLSKCFYFISILFNQNISPSETIKAKVTLRYPAEEASKDTNLYSMGR